MIERASPPDPDAPRAPDPLRSSLAAWPPPGLERLRGDAWRVIDRLAMGGAVFTLPLLGAMTLPQSPWRTGILGESWWVLLVTSLVGLWLLLVGYVELFRALRRWQAATAESYGTRTVALVLADRHGDAGFLVQGGRAYSFLATNARGALVVGRLARVALALGAALWLSAGFIGGILLATRQALGPGGLALFTLLPPALAGAAALVLAAWENTVAGSARKQWHAKPWSRDLARDEIRTWHAALADQADAVPLPEKAPGSGSTLLWGAAAATVALASTVILLAVPVVTTSGVGPVLAEIAAPRASATARRAARLMVVTSLRVPVDPGVTPLMAGEALASLAPPAPGLRRPPPRSHGLAFSGGEYESNPTGLAAHFWARDLVPRLADGLAPEVVTYLLDLGRHSGLQELSVLAAAAEMDEIGAFHTLPLPDDVSWWELTIPKFSAVREAGYAQVGAAVGAAATGRVDEAELRLRELISAGLLLGRDGTTLITNLIGYVLADVGAEALANLYAATGRPDAAEDLRERLAAAERAALLVSSGRGPITISEMPDLVTDPVAVRGLRWEFLMTLSALGPCLNLRRAVFGPPDDFEGWREEVRASLVRFEGEKELLELIDRGWGLPERESALQRVASAFARAMGGGLGSCAELGAAAASSM